MTTELNRVVHVLLGASLCKGFIFQCTVALLTIFLQQNVHVTEEASFNIYGIYGVVVPIVLVLIARAIDRLPAFSLVISGTTLSIVVRLLLFTFQQYAWPELILAATVMAVVDGIGSVGLTLAMKRIIYAKHAGNATAQEQQLDFYMSVDYGLSNLGAALASLCYAALRHLYANDLPVANAVLLMISVGMHVIVLALVLSVFVDAGTTDQPMQNPRESHCMKTCCSGSFWIYMTVCSLLIPVRTLFRHLDLTIPAFLTHVMGTHADFPYIQAINPLVTLVGVSILAGVRYRWPENAMICKGSKYWAIVTGTFICACGFIGIGLMLMAEHPPVDPMVATSIGIFAFSIGEVYWSSIFTSYALGQAPQGLEATYTALISLPSLAVKLPTSLLSNALIRHYCPADESVPCDGVRLFVVIGSIALITPVVLMVASRWLNRRRTSKTYTKI